LTGSRSAAELKSVVGLHHRLDTPGNNLAELRMKASSEETWLHPDAAGAEDAH